MAFLVHDGGHDRLAGLHLGIKLHGHAAALAVGIRLARGGEHFFRLAVGLSGACAEHVRPFFPEQVALREALARERQREPVVFLLTTATYSGRFMRPSIFTQATPASASCCK